VDNSRNPEQDHDDGQEPLEERARYASHFDSLDIKSYNRCLVIAI
jgi:hypothetical protein